MTPASFFFFSQIRANPETRASSPERSPKSLALRPSNPFLWQRRVAISAPQSSFARIGWLSSFNVEELYKISTIPALTSLSSRDFEIRIQKNSPTSIPFPPSNLPYNSSYKYPFLIHYLEVGKK
uniref:Uncharacterized protein n=1 Tax=Solanum tuberosum TaxID=4113 RepID=M1DKP8_SOLTU